jgi:hypothetical protein
MQYESSQMQATTTTAAKQGLPNLVTEFNTDTLEIATRARFPFPRRGSESKGVRGAFSSSVRAAV